MGALLDRLSLPHLPWRGAFWLCALGDLLAVGLGIPALELVCKPLLLPLLGLYWRQQRRAQGHPGSPAIASAVGWALFGSFAGDVFLLFDEQVPVCFLLGLGSFLLAHVQYIRAFAGWQPDRQAQRGASVLSMWGGFPYALALLAYGVVLYAALYPRLDQVMKVAVLAYAGALTAMALYAGGTKLVLPASASRLLMAGAVLFVVSDSCIAVDKFLQPFPHSGLAVMSTYIAAQWLIVQGALLGLKGKA